MNIRSHRAALLGGAACILLTIFADSANAQSAPDATQDAAQDAAPPQAADPGTTAPEDVIIVTGSRIARTGFDTVQPALVLSSEQIDTRGYTNIGQALSELPAFGVPGNNPVGTQSSFGAGQTFVNFFGLGSQRTLTLVNGRRFVSSNVANLFGPTDAGSQVDLNVIPTALIDRIETVAVGGAPIYGSDAIAGTLNIILKRDFEGIEIDGQYGLSWRGDAPDYRIRGIAGTDFGADDRGNITVSGEYNRSGGLTAQDRSLTRAGRFYVTPIDPNSPFDQVLISNRRIPSISQFGIPLTDDFFALSPGQVADFGFSANVSNAAGQALRFDQNGNLIPIDFGTQTGNTIDFVGGNGFDLTTVTNLLTPTERYLANALVSYELTDDIRFFGEGWYARSKGVNLVDQPVYNSALFAASDDPSGNLIIPLSNPFLSPAARETVAANLPAGQDFFYLGRANTDLSPGRNENRVDLYRFVAGFDGTFEFGERVFNWEVSGNYGRSKAKSRSFELVQQNFVNALNATVGPDGTIVCAPGATNSPIPTISSTCAPLNPFGQQISQAARDYVTTIAETESVNTQRVFTASLSGAIATLPGGDLSIALGYENRREKTRFDPGAFFYGQEVDSDPTVDLNGDGDPTNDRTSYGRSIPIDRVSGSFTTNEVFGEVRMPIIGADQDIPFVHSLELEGAARWVDHSTAGSDLTWTAGGRWEPIRDVTIRGNFTRAIRAPAIFETFSPTSPSFETADDPCDARFINAGANPAARAANCAAAGITQPFNSLIVERTAETSLSGNPNLENEKADSWTVGAIFRPRFAPGLTLAIDWVDIKLKNAIVGLSAEQTLNACYDADDFPNEICGGIDRDPTGQITFVRNNYVNAAQLNYQGLISELAYRMDTPFLGANSAVTFGVNYQYLDKLEQTVNGADLDTTRGELGYSKHRATANITYTNAGFTWQTQGVYFGKATFDADEPEGTRDIQTIGDVLFVNTSLAYDVTDNFGVRLIVDNLFDKAPPYPVPGGGGTVAYFPGILGRYVRVGATMRF